MNIKNKLTKISSIILACLIVVLCPFSSAYANNEFYANNDILFFDENACSSYSDSNSILVGNDNLEKILRYYVNKGLSLEQASGIAGNYQQESGFDPGKIEGGNIADENYTPVPGVGFGIAQWTSQGRQAGLIELSKSTNRKITDMSLQLDWSWEELDAQHSSVDGNLWLDNLKSTSTPEDAAYIFHRDFEISADSEDFVKRVRGGNAREIFNTFNGKISSSSGSSSTMCGGASQYVNGFTIYNQFDGRWINSPYGNSTVGNAGCGPSAMAMIITALTGRSVTPDETAKYGAENGTTADGGVSGSNWNIQSKLAPHWGLKTEQLDGSVESISQALLDGGLIITSGKGSSPFTSGGHYIVIRAVTSDGKWLIADSNGTIGASNSEKEWDPNSIIQAGMAKGNVWVVKK